MSKEVMKSEERKDLVIANEQEEFFSDMGAEDFNVPFTRVLADMSDVVKDGTHKAGMIFNTGSGEAVEEATVVLVRRPEKTITVRTDTGDFVASYPFTREKLAELTVRQDGLKRWDRDDNGVYETWNYYILNLDTEEISICPMLSTNFSVAKAWNTRLRLQKNYAPSQIMWKLSTKEVPNGKKTYWKFETPRFAGPVPEDKVEVVGFAKEMFENATVDHAKGYEKEVDDDVADSNF